MTAEPSPRPWRVAEYPQCPGLADVFDASGSPSGLVAGELKPADAALIVDAVNERDRLRDIVRNAVETLEQVYKHADMTDALREVVVETQREARAAIGEDAK